MIALAGLLKTMPERGASDLHLVVGQKPKYRIDGEVVVCEEEPELTKERAEQYLFEIMDEKQKKEYLENYDIDFAYTIDEKFRFRCNLFFQRTGYAAVIRIIPGDILALEDLHLPEIIKSFCELRSGLVLITGPTGSGKSTTLAAMIDYINKNFRKHILTIEDPIEFVHKNIKSIISFRATGKHTESFASALRVVTRQDADVVLVGEMRDLETMALALSAAAMGTLVYGTLHTNSAPKTVDRIINVFPTDRQPQVRTLLSESLRGVVAQQLLLKKSGKGRVAVNEILIGDAAVANVIRDGKVEQIKSIIQSGSRKGMQSMDDTLEKYIQEDKIDGMDAYLKANDKKRFEQFAH